MRSELSAAYDLAETQGWVASRHQLAALGVTRWMVRDRVASGVWTRWGARTIGLRRGELDLPGLQCRAVWETGPRAALDGITALVAAGLEGFSEAALHVSVPHGRAPRQVDGVRRHVVDLRRPGELMAARLPRASPAVAAIRGAQWAASDRQAALILVMSAQQRLLPLARLPDALDTWRPHRRRALIHTLVRDVTQGAQALGELDFAALCRRYRIRAPSHQVVRTTARGRFYLDAGWEEIGLFVEIDGIQHARGLGPVDDALRQNALALASDLTLRVPLLGLRVHEAEFMRQVAQAHQVLRLRAAS